MDKQYRPELFEDKIYRLWEKSRVFKPSKTGKPYTIIMPPPNANASLHAGHGMYTVDDVLIRWKRMQGFSTIWLPGMDHAGFETQFVYEKGLAKQGKSRMDFDRETLYNNIADFVQKNSGLIYSQFRRLGFSADWERSTYAAEPKVIDYVYKTFKRMEKEGLVYRDNYLVNYCIHCGTSLAELEVKHLERVDPLYYIKYGPFILATVRPETKFGDTAVAVNPKDKRYTKWVGQEIEVKGLLGKFNLKVISDDYVDMKFGTGVVKITPAHDPNDFEIGKRHGLEIKQAIDINGRLTKLAGKYAGLKIKTAREAVVQDLKQAGLLVKVDNQYLHAVTVCYKCGRDLEPTIIPNWFIKVKSLKDAVKKAVEKNQVKFYPARFKNHMMQWLEIMHDWPISRQIVWAIRIPVWYQVDPTAANIWVWWLDNDKKLQQGKVQQFLAKGVCLEEIEKGLQKVLALSGESQPKYIVADKKPNDGKLYLPETDTFDTWFSSGQWPLVTLKESEFATRLPTDVMGTLADILKFWVSRMILFSLYLKQKIPFKDVYLWSMVADAKGKKMAKSKGNVINPIELVDKYGADAFRMSLLFGTSSGSKVILADDKVRAMRNLTNKIWNAARFVYSNKDAPSLRKGASLGAEGDKELAEKCQKIAKQTNKYLKEYKLGLAAETVYNEFWHWFCDQKIEEAKQGKISQKALLAGLRIFLKLLHPFVPFVTEAIWQKLPKTKEKMLISAKWPK